MTAAIRPSAAHRLPLSDGSGLLFSWDAEDLVSRWLLDSRTGQAATFSRASAGFTSDALGRLVPAAHSEPRIEAILRSDVYEPCLLLERATTNAIASPEDLSSGSWGKTNTTVSADAVASPRADRSLAADALLETVTNGQHFASQVVSPISAGSIQALSIRLKPNGRTKVHFYVGNGSDVAGVTATLTGSGTVVDKLGGSGSVTHKRIRALADGWYEIEVAGSPNGSSTSATMVLLFDNGSTDSYAGDTTKGVYVWGASWEKNTHRPTTYVNGSRSVDTLTWPFVSRPQALTVFAEFVLRDAIASENVGIVGIGGGASNTDPRCLLYQGATGAFLFALDGGATVSSASVTPSSIAHGDWCEVSGVLRSDGSTIVSCRINGGTVTTGSASVTTQALPSSWAVAQLDAGRFNSTSQGASPLRRIRVAAGERTLDEMAATV